MIPSGWLRRLILLVFLVEVGAALLWGAAQLLPDPSQQAYGETVAGVFFLFAIYVGGPLLAKFLAPQTSNDAAMQARLAALLKTLGLKTEVVLYEHGDAAANTVGLLPSASRIYLTTGLMRSMSDAGIGSVLAHEEAHVAEYHVLLTFSYGVVFAFLSHFVPGMPVVLAGFLGFLALRRYLEYRADAGAARVVGTRGMVVGLRELNQLYPTAFWSRWFVFSSAYPTLPMRVRAVETGDRRMI